MGFVEDGKFESLSETDSLRMMEECFSYDDELRRGGHFQGGEALQSAKNAVTLRMKNGAVDVTDGPYAETKEILGGILLLEARDLNHAIALMSEHPGVKMGPFEIRPADQHINDLLAKRQAAFEREQESNITEPTGGRPDVVSRSEWQSALECLREKEKALTRARDALAAERRRLPMVKIEKDYTFEGPQGKVRLVDLFDGRPQLAVYHFMFAEGVGGWPEAGCPGCSSVV